MARIFVLVTAIIGFLFLDAYAQCSMPMPPAGTKITLVARPCPDSRFDRWENVTCEEGNKSTKCTFTSTGNELTVKPIFMKKPPAPKWEDNM